MIPLRTSIAWLPTVTLLFLACSLRCVSPFEALSRAELEARVLGVLS